jgi:hypothetical protein
VQIANRYYRYQPSGARHFSPKPTVKIEQPVWGNLCARVAALPAARESLLSGSIVALSSPMSAKLWLLFLMDSAI